MKFLKYLKRSLFWKYLLIYLIKPFLDFVWMNIVNFKGRILYFFWFLKKRDFIRLNNQSINLLKDNLNFTNLANEIFNSCDSQIFNHAKNTILNSNNEEFNQSNSKENKYTIDIYSKLDQKIKDKIFNFASSDLMISTAAKYLGIFPILSNIILNYNIPRKPDKVRGAMLWHKDDLGYKSLDLFLCITDLDDDNGPLYVSKANDNLGALSRIDSFIKNPIRGERQKIDLNEFNFYTSGNELIKLEGKKGTALLIDSIANYHRGGNCKNKNRLMLRISYQGIDYIPLKKIINKKLLFNLSINKDNHKDIFKKYLLFKRSSIFNTKVKYFLVNFYNIICYKISKI